MTSWFGECCHHGPSRRQDCKTKHLLLNEFILSFKHHTSNSGHNLYLNFKKKLSKGFIAEKRKGYIKTIMAILYDFNTPAVQFTITFSYFAGVYTLNLILGFFCTQLSHLTKNKHWFPSEVTLVCLQVEVLDSEEGCYCIPCGLSRKSIFLVDRFEHTRLCIDPWGYLMWKQWLSLPEASKSTQRLYQSYRLGWPVWRMYYIQYWI